MFVDIFLLLSAKPSIKSGNFCMLGNLTLTQLKTSAEVRIIEGNGGFFSIWIPFELSETVITCDNILF